MKIIPKKGAKPILVIQDCDIVLAEGDWIDVQKQEDFMARTITGCDIFHSPPSARDLVKEERGLEEEVRAAINRASRENISNTPDFLLAEYLMRCLAAYETATRGRDRWYGMNPKPGTKTENAK